MDTNDILTICRLCLNIETGLENLLHFEKISDKILIMIMECTTVNIDLSDGYSDFICTNCLDLLKKFHEFRAMCLKSDFMLKNYTGIVNKIEFANYLEKCKNNELQLEFETNDEEFLIEDETNNVDVDSLNNDSQLSDAVELEFIDNSEQTLITDECKSIESLHENNLDDSLIEKKFMKFLLTRTKENIPLKSEQKELRVCYICGKLKLTMNQHLLTHKSVRDLKCEKCGKMFSNRQALTKHKYIHNPDNNHVCEKCGTSFSSKDTLARHIRNVHFPTKRHQCSICSRRFEQSYNLKVHIMKHSGESPFKCKNCPESFTSKIKLREHNMNEHNVTPPTLFKCEKCNLTFLYNFQLQAHKKRPEHETGEIAECTVCDKKFQSQQMYQKHMKLEHNLKIEKKTINVKCNVCNKMFKKRKYLKIHEKLHLENGKKFKCEICGKSFLYNGILKEHTRVHTGERPAKCDFCDNAYISFRQLKKHIKSHKFISS